MNHTEAAFLLGVLVGAPLWVIVTAAVVGAAHRHRSPRGR